MADIIAVLVTGASRGIGAAIARLLAPEHGIAVAYDTSTADATRVAVAVRGAGADAVTVRGDVTDADSGAVGAMIGTVVDELGSLDTVLDDAGIADLDRLTDLADEQWGRVLETNPTGAFYVTRAAMPHLQPGGDVVIGDTGGTVDASYAASKAGPHGLTRALARGFGPDGV